MKTKSNRKSKILKNAKKQNKTIKKLNKMKACSDFCENVYINEIDKQNKEFAKENNISYNAKLGRKFRISTCKKNFCNKNCKKTYKYYDKESEKLFKKNIENNFITNMKPGLVEEMKTKGAISYCDGFVYNPFNKK